MNEEEIITLYPDIKGDYVFKTESRSNFCYTILEKSEDDLFYFLEDGSNPFESISYFFNNKKVKPSQSGWSYYNDDNTFQSDDKIYWVKNPKKAIFPDVFTIKTTTGEKPLNELWAFTIENNKKRTCYRFEINHPEQLEINVITFNNIQKLHPLVTKEKGKTIIQLDSLQYISETEFIHDPDILGYLYFELIKDGKPINPSGCQAVIKWYLPQVKDYQDEFAGFMELCKSDSLKSTQPAEFKSLSSEQINKLNVYKNQLSQSILKEINILTDYVESSGNDLEKLDHIYKFVQKKTRYIAKSDSSHSFIPHHPVQTLVWMYGDCKDKSNLIYYLAHYFNIPVKLALVNTESLVPKELIMPNMFNHMIAVYETKSRCYYLDATDDMALLNEVPRDLYGYSYLILDNNTDLISEFSILPEYPSIKIDFKVNLSYVEFTPFQVTLSDCFRKNYYYSNIYLKDTERVNYMKRILTETMKNIEFREIRFKEVNDSLIFFEGTANLKNLIMSDPDGIYIKKGCFNGLVLNTKKKKNDSFPIFIDKSVSYEMNLLFDESCLIQNEKDNYLFKNNQYGYSIDQKNHNQFIIKNTFKQRAGIYSEQEKQDFISHIESYNRFSKQNINIKRKK